MPLDLRRGEGPPDWRLVRGGVSLPQRHVRWYEKTHLADGVPWLWLGRDGDDDVLRFPGWGWVRVRTGPRDISCAWQQRLQADTLDHLLVNHVLPQAAAASGLLVFHASVVQRPSGGAIAFVAPAGTGKSTTAAYLASQGWPVLSDDRLIADTRLMAHPVVPYVRVAPEVATWLGLEAALPPGHHKVRIRLSDHGARFVAAHSAIPLEQVVLLERGASGPALESLPAQQAVLSLLNAQLQPGMDRAEVRERVFQSTASLVGGVPCVRLRMPEGLAGLSRLRDLLAAGPA
jgi:hypothetical protein